jgi:succinate dehydrogenase / fumarate reductase membrane anchor subunit
MKKKTLKNNVDSIEESSISTLHFMKQRCTAALLIPLICWLLYSIVGFSNEANYARGIAIFLESPVNAALLVLFMLSFLYHGFLGMDDIMKDYIHNSCLYKFCRKILMAVCILTYAITVTNLIFFYILFRLASTWS